MAGSEIISEGFSITTKDDSLTYWVVSSCVITDWEVFNDFPFYLGEVSPLLLAVELFKADDVALDPLPASLDEPVASLGEVAVCDGLAPVLTGSALVLFEVLSFDAVVFDEEAGTVCDVFLRSLTYAGFLVPSAFWVAEIVKAFLSAKVFLDSFFIGQS